MNGCQNGPSLQLNNEIKFPQSMAQQQHTMLGRALFIESKILSSDKNFLNDQCNLEPVTNTMLHLIKTQEYHQYVELSQQENLLQLKPCPFQMPFLQHTLNSQDDLL